MKAQAGSSGPGLSETLDEIRYVLFGAWTYRWQAAAVAWLLCAAVWIFILSMPDVYEAKTRLHIDTESSLRPLLQGLAVDSDPLSDIEIMVKTIKSRPMLEDIATRSGLYRGSGTLAGPSGSGELERLTDALSNDISMQLTKNQILEIAFEQEDQGIALSVVNLILDLFIENLFGSNRSDTLSAQEFIEAQLEDYEVVLAGAEKRLADFKKRNVGLMPSEQGNYYMRLQTAMSELESLEFEARVARQRRDGLQRQLAGEVPVFGMISPGGVRPDIVRTSAEIEALEVELTQLRLQYMDAHPDIARIKALLQSLRTELAQQSQGEAVSQARPVDMNPVYQRLKMQFNESELEVQQLMTKQADQARVVKSLKDKMDTIPEIEAELTRLNRHYDVNKTQYDALLQRLERARISGDAEASRTAFNFKVIDPPVVSSAPVGPDRVLLMSFGLAAGLTLGMAFAGLCSILQPVIYSSERLERRFDIPVIGSIRYFRSPGQLAAARRGLFAFSFSMMALPLCFGIIVIFNQESVQLVAQVGDLLG